MAGKYYILNTDRTVTPTDSIVEAWRSKRFGLVASDQIDQFHILTHFLAVNLGTGKEPLIFETLIVGSRHADFQRLYSSWEEAEQGHREVSASFARRRTGRTKPPRLHQ